jgi:hypothetical protein
MQMPVENGKFIYELHDNYGTFLNAVTFAEYPVLTAIVANGKIYYLHNNLFAYYRDPSANFSEVAKAYGMLNYREERDKYETQLLEDIFPYLYVDLTPETSLAPSYHYKYDARKIIFGMTSIGEQRNQFFKKYNLINDTVMLRLICGLDTLESYAARVIERNKATFAKFKAQENYIKYLIDSNDPWNIPKPWELVFTDALQNIPEPHKTVNVVFEFDNTRIPSAETRVRYDSVLRAFMHEKPFADREIETGVALLNNLKRAGIPASDVDCEHISKIMYKGKVYYEKPKE